MATKTLRVDFNSAEFMLDFPTHTSIVSATSEDGSLVFTLETEWDVPDNGTLVYEANDDGFPSLTGIS